MGCDCVDLADITTSIILSLNMITYSRRLLYKTAK